MGLRARFRRRGGVDDAGVEPASLPTQLAGDYPDLPVLVVIDAVAQARVAAARLGPLVEVVEGGVASLARDLLDLERARVIAAARRVGPPGPRGAGAVVVGPVGGSAARAGAGGDDREDEPGTRAGSAMAQVDRFDRLFQVVRAHARGRGALVISVESLCAAAGEHLGVSAVAVTVPATSGGAQTLGTYGALARELEELQVTVGEGPSLQALADGAPIHVDDLRHDPHEAARWPMFSPAALAAGVESLYVLPMRVGAARFGVLTLYLQQIGGIGPGPLGPNALADADVLAAIALDVLLTHVGLLTPDSDGDPSEDRRFFDDRPEIHQATGMVSRQLGVDLGTALLRIRARAYAEDRQLSDLAADVVARRIRFTPDSERELR